MEFRRKNGFDEKGRFRPDMQANMTRTAVKKLCLDPKRKLELETKIWE